MVVLQIRRLFYISIIILACVSSLALSYVRGRENKLQETISNFKNHPGIEIEADHHLENIATATPLHIIIDLKVNAIILNSLLIKYMQSRSSYLWNSEELIPEYVESCAIIKRVVGIYSDISYVRPSDQRRFFDKLWRPRAIFTIWLANMTPRGITQSVLENFWSLDCLNVVIIMAVCVDNHCHSTIYRYTYNPFIIGLRNRIAVITTTNYNISSSHTTSFPSKLKNLYGYKIPISVYHAAPNAMLANYTTLNGARGSVVELMKYFASWMNFTIVLKSSTLPLSSYTQNLPEGKYDKTIVGPVGDLIKGRSELLGNGQPLELATDLDLEFLYPLKNYPLLIAVPYDKELSSITRIFRYVDPIAEILILLSMGLFSLYVTIIHKQNLLTAYFQLLFQKSIQSVSRRLSERIFFFSWLIFAYFIASVHESHVMQSLTSPITSPSIATVEDVINSDLKIVLDYTHFKAIKLSRSHRREELINRSEVNPNYADCILRLGKGERVACVGSQPVVRSGLDTLQKHMITNKVMFHVEPYIIKTPKYSFSVMMVRKGFPYLKKFEEAYINAYKFGLIQKWRVTKHVGTFKKSNDFDGPLQLIQFQGVFCLFAICIIIANITFVGEILFHYFTRNMPS